MRALPLAASLSLVLLATPASANDVYTLADTARLVVVNTKACVDENGVYFYEKCHVGVISPTIHCLVEEVEGLLYGHGMQWPPTIQDCPEPINELPCLYHQPLTCPDRFGLDPNDPVPWLLP